MDAPPAPTALIRFGLFEFDPQSGELRKQGMGVRLQGQPVEILAMLLARPGELVTREELQKRLWPEDTFVDFDPSLNAAVKRLRAALGDSADTPRFIETLARRGYRFIGPVDARGSASAAAEPFAEPAVIPPVESAPRSPLRPRYFLWVALVAVALTSIGLTLYRGKIVGSVERDNSPRRIQSLLVLPLRSLSGDPEQDYFTDGMTDALNARLAGVSALRVISQTSSRLYKGTDKPLSQIARELNVDGVVEGSVLRSGNRIRINVQLVQTGVEKRIWGQTYERDVRDVLTLQSEVTRAIVDEIRVTLTPGEQARLTEVRASNPEALVAYAKGRFYWNRRTEEGYARLSSTSERRLKRILGMLSRTLVSPIRGCQERGTHICRRKRPSPTPGRQPRKHWHWTPIWSRRTPPWRLSSSTTNGTGMLLSASFSGRSS